MLYINMIDVSQQFWLSRCATSTRKLLCNFEAPDQDVFTLYDNWETAVARFPHVSYVWHVPDSIRGIACLSAATVYCSVHHAAWLNAWEQQQQWQLQQQKQ
jgi:hypothetical protein